MFRAILQVDFLSISWICPPRFPSRSKCPIESASSLRGPPSREAECRIPTENHFILTENAKNIFCGLQDYWRSNKLYPITKKFEKCMLIFTRVRKNTFLVLSLALVTSTLTFSRGDSRCCRSLANSSLLMISRSRIGFTSPANAMLKEWKMQTITQNTGDQIWDFQIRKIIANFFIKVFQRIPKSYPRHGWHRRRRKRDTSGRGHRRQRRATGTHCPGLGPRRHLK